MADMVLLDVGGLLLLPDHGAIRRAVESTGAHTEQDGLDRAHYLALAEVECLPEPPPGFARGPFWVAYARAAGVEPDLVAAAAAAIERVQRRSPLYTRVIPGCRRGLRAVAATGVRISLVTNTEHGHVEAILRGLGVCQVGPGAGVRLEALVDSHVVGVAKPDPRIFQLALERSPARAEATIHVGDSLRADVEGARAAGIRPVHFDPLRLCRAADHAHVGGLLELATLLRS